MKSGSHAVVSLGVAAAVLALTSPTIPPWAVVGVALAVGVGIDFDHFLIARYNAGDWRALRACLRDPAMVVLDQESIFAAGEVDAIERIASHLLIGAIVVPAAWLARPSLGVVVAASLYAHVLADAVASARDTVVLDADDVSPAQLAALRGERDASADSGTDAAGEPVEADAEGEPVEADAEGEPLEADAEDEPLEADADD